MLDTITLFGDRVLVTPAENTRSLIHTTSDYKWRYKVVAVGNGRATEFGQYIKPQVEVGDIISVNPQSVQTVEIGNQSVLLVNSSDIIAKE